MNSCRGYLWNWNSIRLVCSVEKCAILSIVIHVLFSSCSSCCAESLARAISLSNDLRTLVISNIKPIVWMARLVRGILHQTRRNPAFEPEPDGGSILSSWKRTFPSIISFSPNKADVLSIEFQARLLRTSIKKLSRRWKERFIGGFVFFTPTDQKKKKKKKKMDKRTRLRWSIVEISDTRTRFGDFARYCRMSFRDYL